MQELFTFNQVKKEKNKPTTSKSDLSLFSDKDFVVLIGKFYIEYYRYEKINILTFEHALTFNKKDGSFTIIYNVLNQKENEFIIKKSKTSVKKNDFKLLLELTQRGFYNGEKKKNFWGKKYEQATEKIFNIFKKELGVVNSSYTSPYYNPLYDMLTDYHLSVNNIKKHNNVYTDILKVYPKKKWLKLNDNKFIPAVLDQYNIKSKFLVGVLSSQEKRNNKFDIKSLIFLCKLFGDNYVDYIKKINWKGVCKEEMINNNHYECEYESEKKSLIVSLMEYSELDNYINGEAILNTISKLFSLKKFLKTKNLNLKIKASSVNELISLQETWSLHKSHFNLGYKLRYSLPEDMIMDIETPIRINQKSYIPVIILTEYQFKLEGMIMKNCMAKQFPIGSFFIHIAISSGNKRINLQYRRGDLSQAKGKANTDVPENFKEAIMILNEKMKKYQAIWPEKEKYELINKN